jgi:hypothetical protein
VDRRATLFLPPAVSVTTLTFTTVLAMVKPLGRIRGGRTPEVDGDEFRSDHQSVPTPINHPRSTT